MKERDALKLNLELKNYEHERKIVKAERKRREMAEDVMGVQIFSQSMFKTSLPSYFK